MWNVGIPACQSQVQRKTLVSAFDRACSRRGAGCPVHAKSHWRISKLNFCKACFILSQRLQFMSFFHSGDICYSRLHAVHALKELPLLRRRLQLMQPSLAGASSGWQAEMRRAGCCGRYKMLSCLWSKRWCVSVFSRTQSSAEWLLVLGGNRPWVSDFGFFFATAQVHINPKHSLTHCHLSFKEQFNTSKAHGLTFWWDKLRFQINNSIQMLKLSIHNCIQGLLNVVEGGRAILSK